MGHSRLEVRGVQVLMEMQLATPPHNREAAWAYEVLLRWLAPFLSRGASRWNTGISMNYCADSKYYAVHVRGGIIRRLHFAVCCLRF